MKTKSLLAKRLAALAMVIGFLATFVPQASAVQPCCAITNIDARTGVVTAQDRTTGHTFQFTASPAVLQKMKVGQGVYANYKTNQVSINNVQPCCGILPPNGKPAKAGVASPNNIIPPSEITPPNGTAATRGVTSPNNVIPPEGGPATRGVPNPNNVQPCCDITRIDK